ncbi:MAG TPA: hypothetical protein VFZ09_28385 [Archangium sp.]|uniref:hypothetical protein n=1 Tax=Archangium sp. TaxID=1872627 RepID=UPI002E317615|nr:hypothetical protein [Archangium sp.]HEX5750182.1 hypothetical protein [Archangium sp.]
MRIARRFYPSGFPSWEDDPDEPVLAYQRTPGHQRWEAAWGEALRWTHWASLMDALRTTRFLRSYETSTQPKVSFEIEPTRWTKLYEDKMAHHIERVFGYQLFPLDLVDVPLPDLRVGDFSEMLTLLGALVADRNGLVNLP